MIHKMRSQISIKVIAPASEAFIGEKNGVKNVWYIHSLLPDTEPSGRVTGIRLKILGIKPERKNTVIAFTP